MAMSEDMLWKVASAGALVVAGFVADKIVDVTWKLATGHTAPRDEDEATAKITELVIFGALSGIFVTLIRRQALRGANRFYAKRVGTDRLGIRTPAATGEVAS